MTLILSIHIAVIVSLGVLWGMVQSRKPLSEDDGSWFYSGFFQKKGIRLFQNYFYVHGYFGIQWLFAKFHNLFPWGGLSSTYYFKAFWYALTALSIYWMSDCFWHDPNVSLLAALLFLGVTFAPNTLFFLTYAEHFFLLPLNLAVIFIHYGFVLDHPGWFFLAGVMASWAFQFKPTALLMGAVLPMVFFLFRSPWLAFLSYGAGFAVLYLLPLLLIRRYGAASREIYLKCGLGPVIHLLEIIMGRMGISIPGHFLQAIRYSEGQKRYTDLLYRQSFKGQLLSLKHNMLPSLKDLRLLVLLALLQALKLPVAYDPFSLILLLIFIAFLLMQYLQKNFYTPHFNPVWAPISLLAARTCFDMVEVLSAHPALLAAVSLLVLLELLRVAAILIKSMSIRRVDEWGFLSPVLGKLFRLAEVVGGFIRNHSGENDRLFVWGDQPSIYLYADRLNISPYPFLYAHQGRITFEEELLNLLREDPPEWIVFYNYKVNDGWNMQRLTDTIGVPYEWVNHFQVCDDQGRAVSSSNGIVLDFPLYRRKDDLYKEILIDRAIAQDEGAAERKRSYLEKALQVAPDDCEASVRLGLLDRNAGNNGEDRRFLSENPAGGHGAPGEAIVLRMMAELDAREGNVAGALEKYLRARGACENDFRTCNGLGELSLQIGKKQEAFQFFKKAMALNPYSADAYNNLGVMLAQDGQREKALACFRKSLSIIPGHPDTLSNMTALGMGASA